MFNKIKTIKDARKQAKGLQNALSDVTAEGSGGSGGAVRITIDGNQRVLAVLIDDRALHADKSKLEDAVKDAVNDAIKNVQRKAVMKMKDLGGMDAFKGLGL
ncbi:MAG: hypothetical protein ACD_76C00149G0009 [uncultured bacterium]|nr:MAG: hypothetical protein ACD_76C00149G0009 [uncultured bacterium]